jgi:hypothetical protein
MPQPQAIFQKSSDIKKPQAFETAGFSVLTECLRFIDWCGGHTHIFPGKPRPVRILAVQDLRVTPRVTPTMFFLRAFRPTFGVFVLPLHRAARGPGGDREMLGPDGLPWCRCSMAAPWWTPARPASPFRSVPAHRALVDARNASAAGSAARPVTMVSAALSGNGGVFSAGSLPVCPVSLLDWLTELGSALSKCPRLVFK